jgi:hypothetical protein
MVRVIRGRCPRRKSDGGVGATMSRSSPSVRQSVFAFGRSVRSIALWTLWLALSVVLAAQLYVAVARELPVPAFILRRIERDIAGSGVRAVFGRTSFDPTGRVLIEHAELSLPEISEPVVRIRAAFVELNPWLLLVGRFEPRKIRVTGLDAAVPAMLSASGAPDPMIRELDATVMPAGRQLTVAHLSARIAGVAVTARGAIALPRRDAQHAPTSLAEIVSTHFPKFCRQLVAIKAQLDTLEDPVVRLELAPSDARTAVVLATLSARSFSIQRPLAAHIRGLRIVTQLPLIGDAPSTSHLDLTADELLLPYDTNANGVHATLTGRFLPGGFQFEPRELQLTANHVEASGFAASALSAQLFPQPLPQLKADVVAQLMGAPIAVHADADFSDRHATLQFAGAIAPRLLTPLSDRLRANVRTFFDFDSLDCRDGEARLGPGWKFEGLTARVAVRGIRAYHVAMDEGRATVELTPDRFYSPEAYGRIGENFARGSYEHDLHTHQYRFLLQGRLRPMDISGWFREWWPDFFEQFKFPVSPPLASVDVAGFWREGHRSTVFVFADVVQPVIRGAAFDRARTRLFIRPSYFEGLDTLATRGNGALRGTFTYVTNPETHAWRTLDLDLSSTIDPALAARVIGPSSEKILAEYKFAQPPQLKVKGRLDGSDAPEGVHQTLQIAAKSTGEFRVHEFPLEDVSFVAAVHDEDVTVENIEARLAGGAALGRVKVAGAGKDRRLGFTLTLQDASLGQLVGVVQHYIAELDHRPPTPPGKFVQEKANVRLDLAAVAEGRYGEPYGLVGDGSVALRGEEIGEVPLLGMLSSLLKFTALRFTSGNAKFKLNNAKIEFPEVALRGANSTIDAHGEYALDRKELDFKAKVFPFQESNNILKSVVGAVLSPISNVFEVKLTGTLEKPEWAFVMGPTNFIRSLAPENAESAKPADSTHPGPSGAPGSPEATPTPTGPGDAPKRPAPGTVPADPPTR